MYPAVPTAELYKKGSQKINPSGGRVPAGPVIAVIGGRKVTKSLLVQAEEVGRFIALKGAILICGGLSGVMEAASRGAHEAGGVTVGILPQDDRRQANRFISVPVVTGFGMGRNVIIARSADALIAVGGAYGTLSEIAFGLQLGKPVIGLGTWQIKGVIEADDAQDAVDKAFRALGLER
jgi:uncharacterized protein (TIGR00725 family)